MRKLIVIVLVGCVFVISQGFRNVAAGAESVDPLFDQGGKIPLSHLAGTYALTAHGSIAFCFENAPPFALVPCGSTGSIVVPLSILDVGVTTTNTTGTSCATFTETDTDLPPGAFPPGVFTLHATSNLTSYDPTTGTGDLSSTGYFGGQCHGATFDSTGATVASTATFHFAVSNRGKQIDSVLTSLTNPVGAIASFSYSATELRH